MRDAARKLLSVSWRRAPKGGETHSSPPAAAASRSSSRRILRHAAIGAGYVAGTIAVLATGAYVAIDRVGPPNLEATQKVSTTVLDRRDRLLRAFTTPDGRWRLPVEAADVDQRYLAMLMAFEDKRFYDHGGVDMRSLARAAVQLVENRRIVSGASTLTMQVARLIEGHYERSGSAKVRQIVGALRLEHHLTKPQILSLYLRLAPFGGNIEGVRAASLAYFGKEPRRLSIGEAALLVALPQSPEWRRPDRNPRAARIARDRVLQRAREEGVITAAEADRATPRAGSNRPPCISEARATSRGIRGSGRSETADSSPHHRPHGAEGTRGPRRRADQTARARSCRRPFSPSTTPPAR